MRRIAQLQRPHWELRLIRESLREKLGNLDAELNDLLEGREYVPIGECLPVVEYHEWVKKRHENLIRMVEFSKSLLTVDFPNVLAGSGGEPPDPRALVSFTNRAARFYAETVSFERDYHTVRPPAPYQHLHNLQKDGTVTIRNVVWQLFSFLDQMIESAKAGASKPLAFEFVAEEVPYVEAFSAEMARIQPLLRDIDFQGF